MTDQKIAPDLNRVERLAVELYQRGTSPQGICEMLSITPGAVQYVIAKAGVRRTLLQAATVRRDNWRSQETINNFTSLVDVVEHCAHKLNIPVSLLLLILTERLTPGLQDSPPTCIASNCDFDCVRQCSRALDEIPVQPASEK